MKKYDFFISYCKIDGEEIATMLSKGLMENGYSVFFDVDAIQAGTNFNECIIDAISNCDYFIPIITDASQDSAYVMHEIDFACSRATGRALPIIPIIVTEQICNELMYYIGRIQCLKIDQKSNLSVAIKEIVTKIHNIASHKIDSSLLYEKLLEYRKLNNHNKEAEVLCEIINLSRENYRNTPEVEFKLVRKQCEELLKLYENLSKYVGNYDEESRKVSHKIIAELDNTYNMLTEPSRNHKRNLFNRHLIFASYAIRLIFLDRQVRYECADILSNGDEKHPFPDNKFINMQKPFVEVFYQESDKIKESGFEESELYFIAETKKYIFEHIASGTVMPHISKRDTTENSEFSKNDEILVSIAKFMREGNKLFDVLQKNGIAGDFLKCLLTSYERLKNYCEIVGANEVAVDCVERIVEIRNEIDKHSDDNNENEKVEKGIKSLLGFTLKNSGNYDVFISFKNEDSDLAERIYRYCHKNMKEPFWSKKSLPELSKSDYEDAIYAALRNSKHFVIVLSKLEYLNANWIKTEMSTFHRAITEGRKMGANFVFVVTDDVYKAIIDSNKTCLDERYCGYQIIKMSEYEEVLVKYLS